MYNSLQDFFHSLYKSLNDIDYVEALDRSFHLPLQALCYQRKGQYFEALATYESMLQINTAPLSQRLLGQSKDQNNLNVSSGIAGALKGMGLIHTSSAYVEKWTTDHQQVVTANQLAQMQLNEWDIREISNVDRSLTSFSKQIINGPSAVWLQREPSEKSKRQQQVTVFASLLPHYQQCLNQISKYLKLERNDCVQLEMSKLYDASTILNLLRINDSTSNKNDNTQTLSISATQRVAATLRSTMHGHTISDYQKTIDYITDLLSNGIISPVSGLASLKMISDSLHSEMENHSISPFLYRCWDHIYSVIGKLNASSSGLQRTSNLQIRDIVDPSIQLQECLLLWKKGSTEAALDRLGTVVIPALSEVCKKIPSFQKPATANKKNPITSNDNSPLNIVASDIYCEALRLNGLWNSHKGSRTSSEILKNNLEPSLQFAASDQNKIQSYLSLATFTSTLFNNIQARIQSVEWIQSDRVFKDREEELKLCLELQQQSSQAAPNSTVKTNNPQAQVLQVQENRNLLRHIVMLKKEIEMDKKERNHLLQSINNYLILSIEYYLKILFLSKDSDPEVVFRFINLWFKNNQPTSLNVSTQSTNGTANIAVNTQAMNDIIYSYLVEKKILTYKFITLHYQIFSRLGQTITTATSLQTDPFQKVLQEFIFQLCLDHPYHVLPQLFALIHEQTVDSLTFKSNNQSTRSKLAENVLLSLLTKSSISYSNSSAAPPEGSSLLIKNIQIMLENYHELAKTSTEQLQNAGRTKNIKFKEIQAKGKRFNENVLNLFSTASSASIPNVITLQVPINSLKIYESNYNLIRIKDFAQVFHITENGISRPKIISCVGENGLSYKQLVKGGDDMRQDAVMEQVFENINGTLQKDYETSKRNLMIRTYKIIPLTPQTGVLQWVENTLPFGAILCDRLNGLHGRYKSSLSDYSHKECREALQKCADVQEKELRFQDIMKHFLPVFRYFFIEKFSSNPIEWFNKRNNYVRSIAANSMTGFILGIGDRHAHNILIDQISGECIHIDFGIVFDQGKGLGTPETVPFRLTRDIVDGMGINGVEGPFRRCSEEVLRVLRENSMNLLTILEVVIFDPLYKWSLSPLKARNKQLGDNANPADGKNDEQAPDFHENIIQRRRNVRPAAQYNLNDNNPQLAGDTTARGPHGNFGKDAAERTLMKIRNKLRGYEELSFETLTVSGHVEMLINEARDPSNLCKIFPGWAPWL
jgi:tetratricopeptide (TPR) repeat protein